METCRDGPSACLWEVHLSIKAQLSSLLAYQPSPAEGYSITSCNSNNHFHSCSLSLSVSFACLSVSCHLQSTRGNWKWAIKCSRRSATWEARRRARIALWFMTTRHFPHCWDKSVGNVDISRRVHEVRWWRGWLQLHLFSFHPWDVRQCRVKSTDAAPRSPWWNKQLLQPHSLICRFSLSQLACLRLNLILEADFTPKVLKWKRVVFHVHFLLLSHLPRSLPFLWIRFYPPTCSFLWGMKM